MPVTVVVVCGTPYDQPELEQFSVVDRRELPVPGRVDVTVTVLLVLAVRVAGNDDSSSSSTRAGT